MARRDCDLIRRHYNARPNRTVKERMSTRNIRIRAVHNYVKSCLIQQYVQYGDSVLDIGVGKCGDLLKYKSARISELYGVDIADRSILDGVERARNSDFDFKIILKSRDGLNTHLRIGKLFNIVSFQFSFHYSFVSEQSLEITLTNISEHLLVGGYVLMTIPSKQVILDRIANNSCSNSYYTIELRDKTSQSIFGNGYYFSLVDSLDRCIEYMVDVDELDKRMKERGMERIEKIGFPEYIDKHKKTNENQYRRMCRTELNEEEWEVVRLNMVIVYRKVA